MFLTNKQAQEKISGLETRVSDLEAEVNTANETISTLQSEAGNSAEEIVTLKADLQKATDDLQAANATIADQEKTITAANEKLSTFDAEVEKKVLLNVASLGFKGEIPNSKEDKSSSKPDLSGLTGIAKVSAAFKAAQK
jgi:chromosome segregation ATPase